MENVKIGMIVLLTTGQGDDRVGIVREFFNNWDLNELVVEVIVYPLIAFIFLKFVNRLFGKKVELIVDKICTKFKW